MQDIYSQKMATLEALVTAGLTHHSTSHALSILGGELSPELLEHASLYSETLPKGREEPFTLQQRYIHFLWDAFDKLPLCLIVPFSIPFRRMLAENLFKKVGPGLICEENVRFNFGHYIELGEQVFFNRGCFMDTKAGLKIGDGVCLAEDVRIFTHSHSEASHLERSYAPVVIKDHAKIYAGATLLPGVTVGEEAIVGSGSMVTKDVPDGMVVVGSPAKVIRERQTDGKHGEDLDHIWLF